MLEFAEKETFAFSLIVFGKLGDSAKLSLNSILKTGVSRICVAGDKVGLAWLKTHVPESQRKVLCPHDIPEHGLYRLKLDSYSLNEYSIFGEDRFIKLTTFKWYLLKNVLENHDYLDYVIFSDLDVLWLKSPTIETIKSRILRNFNAAIQDDTPANGTVTHYCTGIMYWTNTDESRKILEILYDIQLHQNSIGDLIPDEPVFNNWFRSMVRQVNVESLNPDEFVIGHRYFKLLIAKKLHFEEVVAFHANYVIGEKAKFRRLKTIDLRINHDLTWVVFYLRELTIKVFQKFLANVKRR